MYGELTRPFVPASMFTPTEGSITKLAFVLLLRYRGRFSRGIHCRGSGSGGRCCRRHDEGRMRIKGGSIIIDNGCKHGQPRGERVGAMMVGVGLG